MRTLLGLRCCQPVGQLGCVISFCRLYNIRDNPGFPPHRGASLSATSRPGQSTMGTGPLFFLDDFASRQWEDLNYSGTRISYPKDQFVQDVHRLHEEGCALVDGYAPFCKHLFVPNMVGAKLGALVITNENRQHLECGYSRRRPEELAVLTRWFSAEAVSVPDAKFLDVILYSREQLEKEYAAMQRPADLPQGDWGIISLKAQDEDHETPMQPITIMRNSLGVEEGGSGVPLDRRAYEASVAFWESRAAVAHGKPSGE